jgi:ABC-type transport system involved in multi-copper enzyme maturation permease subunit
MFSTLLTKELKAIINSPKFAATFAVCSILMLLSVYIGVLEYRASVSKYEAAQTLIDQSQQEQRVWVSVPERDLRKPDPMQIFVSGLSNDLGRWSNIGPRDPVQLEGSTYSEDTVYAVFRFIDFAFIVQVVLSLFAILFTYDAINGEREKGTLQLVFSNAVPRAKFLLAKSAGAWLGLVVPVLIPILLSILLVLLFNVPMTAEHWKRLIALLGVSMLFFTSFIVLGIFFSAVSRHSRISFMYALVVWIAFVFIIPRAGVITSAQIVAVPSVAEIQGQQDAYAKDKWAAFMEKSEKRWMARNLEQRSDNESDSLSDAETWKIIEEEDSIRKEMEQDVQKHQTELYADLRQKKNTQEKLGLTLSRFSPASSYMLAAMNLAGTDLEEKNRYEDAMNEHRDRFNNFISEKEKEDGLAGRVMITFDSESGFNIRQGRDEGSLDLSQLPVFSAPVHTFSEALRPAIIDMAILALYIFIAFAGAFVMFLKYDVR